MGSSLVRKESMSEPIPLYGRGIGKFTIRWCPRCDLRKTVPQWRDICPDCDGNLMPIPERQPIFSGIYDLPGLYEIMELREVSQFLLSRELRITRSRISRLARGEQLATQTEAERLACVLGVEVGHLTGELTL